jgi:hypothetical protein
VHMMLVDTWVETVPSAQETTGVSFHFPAPTAQAPQAVLLAPFPTTADPSVGWQLSELAAVAADTLEWARLRSLDPGKLPRSLRSILPAVYLPDDPVTGVPLADLTGAPDDYARPTGFFPPRLTSISSATIIPGEDAVIVGANLVVAGSTTVLVTTNAPAASVDGIVATGCTLHTSAATAPGIYVVTASGTDQSGASIGTATIGFNVVRPHATTISGPGSGGFTQAVSRTRRPAEVYIWSVSGYGLSGASVTIAGNSFGMSVAKTGTDTQQAIAVQLSVPVTLTPPRALGNADAIRPARLGSGVDPPGPPPELDYIPVTLHVVVSAVNGDAVTWPITVLLATYS